MLHDRLRRLIALAVLTTGLAAAGCGGTTSSTPSGDHQTDDVGSTGKADRVDGATHPSTCVGVRGNGPRIFSHFGALARIHEHVGPIDGIAGGSSGSVTTFLTESMYANPNVFECGKQTCSDARVGLRMSLMFKSIAGYLEVFGDSEEVVAFQQLAPLLPKIRERDIGGLIEEGNFLEARDALVTIFESEDIRDLINEEVIDLLKNSPDPVYHVKDVWESIQNFGSFTVDSPLVFLRPGILDFDALADKIDRLASFYAAYGPADDAAWQSFFARCTDDTRGKSWDAIADMPAGDGQTCGELFRSMASAYRETYVANEETLESRLDDPVGRYLTTLVSTSVLEDDAADTFYRARRKYRAAEEYTFDVSFDDVSFGYWGRAETLEQVADNPNGYEDAKTAKFRSLGEAPYEEVLDYSPAEPGLARALEITDGRISAGGWSDLEPSLVLKNAGCDEVVLVTRRGASRGFGTAVARQLGMTDAQADALYDLDGESAVRRSLAEADGVGCTAWDKFTNQQIDEIRRDGYTAPLETSDAYFTDASRPYSNITAELGLPSCTPGVPAE